MAIALVNHIDGSQAGGTSKAVTLTGTTAGNLVVVLVGGEIGSGLLATNAVTDDKSNTYTRDADVHNSHTFGGSGSHTALFHSVITTGGDLVITATATSAVGTICVFASEWSGAASNSELRGAKTLVALAISSDNVHSGDITPDSQAGDLVIGVAEQTDFTPGTGYTLLDSEQPNTSIAVAYKLVAAGATEDVDFTVVTTYNSTVAAGIFATAAAAPTQTERTVTRRNPGTLSTPGIYGWLLPALTVVTSFLK